MGKVIWQQCQETEAHVTRSQHEGKAEAIYPQGPSARQGHQETMVGQVAQEREEFQLNSPVREVKT